MSKTVFPNGLLRDLRVLLFLPFFHPWHQTQDCFLIFEAWCFYLGCIRLVAVVSSSKRKSIFRLASSQDSKALLKKLEISRPVPISRSLYNFKLSFCTGYHLAREKGTREKGTTWQSYHHQASPEDSKSSTSDSVTGSTR